MRLKVLDMLPRPLVSLAPNASSRLHFLPNQREVISNLLQILFTQEKDLAVAVRSYLGGAISVVLLEDVYLSEVAAFHVGLENNSVGGFQVHSSLY